MNIAESCNCNFYTLKVTENSVVCNIALVYPRKRSDINLILSCNMVAICRYLNAYFLSEIDSYTEIIHCDIFIHKQKVMSF